MLPNTESGSVLHTRIVTDVTLTPTFPQLCKWSGCGCGEEVGSILDAGGRVVRHNLRRRWRGGERDVTREERWREKSRLMKMEKKA